MTADALPAGTSEDAAAPRRIRPFYWSVWREIWENHSLYIAPLIVAAVEVFGFCISAVGLPERRRAVLLGDPHKIRSSIEWPYDMTAMMMMVVLLIVGAFYCLDALYGERRERSILFWKSLPVSDLTTVLSKATIPCVVLPLIAFVMIICVQVMILLVTSGLLVTHGMSPASTWTYIPFFQNSIVLLYGLIALSLWYAPIYGWLLLVSVWARKAAFLWAVLPWVAASMFERITFGTSLVPEFIKYRLLGFAPDAFDFRGQHRPSIMSLGQLTPGHYLASPGVWLGLLVAVALVAAAVRLRRYEGPL